MAITRAFRRVNGGSTDQVQTNVNQAITEVTRSLILDGRLIETVELKNATVFNVEHKLGRAIRGYMIVSSSAQATFQDNIANGTDLNLYVAITASADTTVNLWVF